MSSRHTALDGIEDYHGESRENENDQRNPQCIDLHPHG